MNLYSSRTALVYYHPGTPVPEMPLPEGYEVRSLNATLVDSLFNAPEDANRRRSYHGFLAGGCQGIVVINHGKWASVGWYATPDASIGPPHVSARFYRGRYWLFHEHTAEQHRRKGLQKALIARMLEQICAKDPSPSIFTDVRAENIPSQRAQVACGFVPGGKMRFYTVDIPRLKTRNWVTWFMNKRLPRKKVEG